MKNNVGVGIIFYCKSLCKSNLLLYLNKLNIYMILNLLLLGVVWKIVFLFGVFWICIDIVFDYF